MKARFVNLAEEQREVDYFPQPACKRNRIQLGFRIQLCNKDGFKRKIES